MTVSFSENWVSWREIPSRWRSDAPPLAPVLAEHQHLARVGGGQAFADLDGGGLAGAVGARGGRSIRRDGLRDRGRPRRPRPRMSCGDRGATTAGWRHAGKVLAVSSRPLTAQAHRLLASAARRSASSRSVKSSRDSSSLQPVLEILDAPRPARPGRPPAARSPRDRALPTDRCLRSAACGCRRTSSASWVP